MTGVDPPDFSENFSSVGIEKRQGGDQFGRFDRREQRLCLGLGVGVGVGVAGRKYLGQLFDEAVLLGEPRSREKVFPGSDGKAEECFFEGYEFRSF